MFKQLILIASLSMIFNDIDSTEPYFLYQSPSFKGLHPIISKDTMSEVLRAFENVNYETVESEKEIESIMNKYGLRIAPKVYLSNPSFAFTDDQEIIEKYEEIVCKGLRVPVLPWQCFVFGTDNEAGSKDAVLKAITEEYGNLIEVYTSNKVKGDLPLTPNWLTGGTNEEISLAAWQNKMLPLYIVVHYDPSAPKNPFLKIGDQEIQLYREN